MDRIAPETGTPDPLLHLDMDGDAAKALSRWLVRNRRDPLSQGVREALWLRTILLEARKRVSRGERPTFHRRADQVLAALSDPTTVGLLDLELVADRPASTPPPAIGQAIRGL